MNIAGVIAKTKFELKDISDSPCLDVQWLLLEVLGQDNASYLLAHGEEELTRAEEEKLAKLVARRATGEPLAYILGWWEFFGRKFMITPVVLVPRPETEELVELALERIRQISRAEDRALTIADIGTGSGCIAITLELMLKNLQFSSASRRTNFQIIATDISVKALNAARENARRFGVTDRIEWRLGNMLDAINGDKVDLIVSNPPYVPTRELEQAKLSPTPETIGLTFEPRLALDGGADGQKYVRQIRESGLPYIMEATNGEVIAG